jgi:hypothetical protein
MIILVGPLFRYECASALLLLMAGLVALRMLLVGLPLFPVSVIRKLFLGSRGAPENKAKRENTLRLRLNNSRFFNACGL